MSEEMKYVVYLSESLESGVAINTATHLAAQFGSQNTRLGGDEVRDKDGNQYNGLPIYPNVILKTCEFGLKAVIEKGWKLQVDSKAQLLVYPEAGKLTTTDAEFRDLISSQSADDINVLGCLVFGRKNVVNRLSKKAKNARLWN